MRTAFLGTGAMGSAMARNLLRAGHEIAVWNRSRQRAEPLGAAGARVADTPADAAREAEVAITMLADDQAVEEVASSLLKALPRGAIHVSMSTVSPSLALRLADAHTGRGQVYVAAPVFGRPEAAAEAKLFIVAAGPKEHVERCRPLFEAMGRTHHYLGENPGSANVVKLAGNFLIASMLEALGEAFALVRKSGVPAREFLDTVNEALFHSPLYANYGARIASEAFEPAGFQLKLGLKDVRLALQTGDENAVPLPIASLLRDRFLTAMALGRGGLDWSAVATLSAEQAGLGKP